LVFLYLLPFFRTSSCLGWPLPIGKKGFTSCTYKAANNFATRIFKKGVKKAKTIDLQ